MVISVSYHDTVTKLQEVSHEPAGPFDRYDWYALLQDYGTRPVIALGESEYRRVALPLMEGPNGLESLSNWFTFSWRIWGSNDEWADETLRAIARDLRKRTRRIDLRLVPGEDNCVDRLQSAFRSAGWMVFRKPCDENHILYVDGRSFAEYWSYRSGQMRTTLKRKGKKVDIEIDTVFHEDNWRIYQDIYAKSWKPSEEREDLLEAFARREGELGHLRLGIARADGKPVAAQFWTVEKGTAYIHKLAHIEEANPLSAGTTLTAAMFEHVIDTDKVTLVDFGTGTDAYKSDWMEHRRPRYALTCLDWRQPSSWGAIIKQSIRRLAPQKLRS